MQTTKLYFNKIAADLLEARDSETAKAEYFANYAAIVQSLNVALTVERRQDLEKAVDQIAIAITEVRVRSY
jgi:CRISPR/Cas system-associated exonuclease Cas4 (RecB family)